MIKSNLLAWINVPVILAIILCLNGCLKVDTDLPSTYNDSQVEVAFPLFSSEVDIVSIAEATDTETSIEVLPDNSLILLYRGPLVEGTALQLFPPIFGGFPISIPDTNFEYRIPIDFWEDIHRLTLGQTNLTFQFQDRREGTVDITLTIPEMTLNGEPFTQEFKMENGSLTSPPVSIAGYEVVPVDNAVNISYGAVNADGEKWVLEEASFSFDFLAVSYIEGIFTPRTVDIRGDFIEISILDSWKSGGIVFEDPSLHITVENSIGLKGISEGNQLAVITTEGQSTPVISPLLDEGVVFNYPRIEDRGQSVITEIILDRNNSNIADLFSGKASRISYDLDATITNQDSGLPGFVSSDGFFKIEPILRLPLNIRLEKLVLEEVTDVDFTVLEEVQSGEIKWFFSNQYPIAVKAQAYLIQNSVTIDSFFDSSITIDAADINPAENTFTFTYSEEKLNNIRSADSVAINARFDSPHTTGFQLLDNTQSLIIKAGMLAKLK